MRRFFLAIVLLSTVLCEEDIEKYVSPCPGSVNVEGSTYRTFVDKYVDLNGEFVTKCKEEYFSSIPNSCDDSHKECVKLVQEFMWNGCHWRLLYDIEKSNKALTSYMESAGTSALQQYFQTLKKDDAVYKFATKCGSWDWTGILIMIVCAFFGSYIVLWIVGGIMKCTKKSPEKTEKVEWLVCFNKSSLKQAGPGDTRNGNGVANVLHPRAQLDEPLQSHSPPRMRRTSVATKVQVPVQSLDTASRLVVLRQQSLRVHLVFQHSIVIFPHRSSDDLSLSKTPPARSYDPWHQQVHSGHRLSVAVRLHVEGLDGLGVVGQEQRLVSAVLLAQILLVLRLQVDSPLHRHLEPYSLPRQHLHGLRVGEMAVIGAILQHLQLRRQRLLHALRQERDIFLSRVEERVHRGADDACRQLLQRRHVRETHLRLHHPEFAQMTCRVGVLRAKRRAEGVDATHRVGDHFCLQLSRHGEIGGRVEEGLQVDVSVLLHADAEHLASAFAVVRGDDRSHYLDEVRTLQRRMNALADRVPHAEHRSLEIGAGTEVRNGAEKLGAVELAVRGLPKRCLLLHRVTLLVAASKDGVRTHTQLDSILVLRGSGLLQNALQLNAGACCDVGNAGRGNDTLLIRLRTKGYLNSVQIRSVVHDHKREVLERPLRTNPPLNNHLFPYGILHDCPDRREFGRNIRRVNPSTHTSLHGNGGRFRPTSAIRAEGLRQNKDSIG